MADKTLEGLVQEIESSLDEKSIYELRQVGRCVGVHRPTDMKKDELIDKIIKIATNQIDPVAPTTRGAPPKSRAFDQALVNEINVCRNYYLNIPPQESVSQIIVAECDSVADEQATYNGVLYSAKGYWFIKAQNNQTFALCEIYAPTETVERYNLREGDTVVCKAKLKAEKLTLYSLISINGVRPDMLKDRPKFENFKAFYSNSRFTLDSGSNDNTLRVIDLFAPIGNGQRALIVAPPHSGKSTLIYKIANSLSANFKKLKVFTLFIGERPEDAEEIKSNLPSVDVMATTFDMNANQHVFASSLTLEKAKRVVEAGEDAVILLDSLNNLIRAYDACSYSSKTLYNGLNPEALSEPKKFLGSARNTTGGSLTIISTVSVNTGNPIDDAIYEEFKSASNMQIVLSSKLVERGIFPAIDIRASHARKAEALLTPAELTAANRLRSLIGGDVSEKDILNLMQKTQSNDELCKNLEEWIKLL